MNRFKWEQLTHSLNSQITLGILFSWWDYMWLISVSRASSLILINFLNIPKLTQWSQRTRKFIIATLFDNQYITKICLYNVDPLKSNFHIVKLGFTEVDIIFLISAQKHRLWVLVRTATLSRGGSNEYPQFMFWAVIWKISEFFIWKFSFSGGKHFSIFE